jgi:hypothetical protein
MSNINKLPDQFSGIAEVRIIDDDFVTGREITSIYTKYYSNGELHREDGPAVLLEGKPHGYWVNGRQYSEEEYGHFLEKKALREKLESNLGEKGLSNKGKI